jgi:hypothetical protein
MTTSARTPHDLDPETSIPRKLIAGRRDGRFPGYFGI